MKERYQDHHTPWQIDRTAFVRSRWPHFCEVVAGAFANFAILKMVNSGNW